jgi:hypothetical protein
LIEDDTDVSLSVGVVDSEGGMMTMDHNPDRLNIHVDKDGTVKKVTHG